MNSLYAKKMSIQLISYVKSIPETLDDCTNLAQKISYLTNSVLIITCTWALQLLFLNKC